MAVAIVAAEHADHEHAVRLINGAPQNSYALAAHSLAEAYNTLTRSGPSGQFRFSAAEAWSAIQTVADATVLIGMTPGQTLDAIGRYALSKGTGPRLYDHLIGEVALAHGLTRIVTTNVRHMRSLFPEQNVVSITEELAQ